MLDCVGSIRQTRFMKSCTIALLLICTSRAADLRQDVLESIFPGMQVVATTRLRAEQKHAGALAYPDAFANETVYQVNGPPSSEIERCASTQSRSREVQLQVFPWPRVRFDLLAVVQYRFIGANPPGSCWSVGMLVHLSRRPRGYEVIERRLVEPAHHTRFAGVRLVDLTGDGVEELVVEPDSGGPGAIGTTLLVFDLSGRRLRQVLATQSRLEYLDTDRYSQVLDVERSVASGGSAVCFDLTVYAKARVSHECYPVGTGVDEKQARLLDQRLRAFESQPRP